MTSLAISSDGSTLACIEGFSHARLWNIGGETSVDIDVPMRFGTAIEFSPDGRTLAIGGEGIFLWNVENHTVVKTLVPQSGVQSIAFDPSGKRILWGNASGQVRSVLVGEMAASELLVSKPSISVSTVAIGSDGKRFAVGREDGSYAIVDSEDGHEVSAGQIGSAPLLSMAFDRDHRRLAAGAADGMVTVVDTDDGKVVSRFAAKAHWKGREVSGQVVELAFDPTSDRISVAVWRPWQRGAVEICVSVWDITSCRRMFQLEGYPPTSASSGSKKRRFDITHKQLRSLAYSPDGTTISAGIDHYVYFWGAKDGQFRLKLHGTGSRVFATAMSSNRRFARNRGVTASNRADRIDLDYVPESLDEVETQTEMDSVELSGHLGLVQSATFSPDETRLASAGADGIVNIWDTTSGQKTLQLETSQGGIRRLQWSRDGRRLSCIQFGMGTLSRPLYRLRVFNPETGDLIRSLPGHVAKVADVDVSADNKYVASVDELGILQISNLETGKEFRVIHCNRKANLKRGESGEVVQIAISRDAEKVATGERGGLVRVRETDSQTILSEFELESEVRELAFDMSGTRLAAVGGTKSRQGTSGAIAVWNSVDDQWTKRKTDDAILTQVEFLPKESGLIVRGGGKIAHIVDTATVEPIRWIPDWDRIVDFSCNQATNKIAVVYRQSVEKRLATRLAVIDIEDMQTLDITKPLISGTASEGVWRRPYFAAAEMRAMFFREYGGAISLQNVVSGDRVSSIASNFLSGMDAIDSVRLSPDATRLVIVDPSGLQTRESNNLSTWGSQVAYRTWEIGEPETVRAFIDSGHDEKLSAIAFSIDGKMLASCGLDRKFTLSDTESGKAVFQFRRFPYEGLSRNPKSASFAVLDVNGRVFAVPASKSIDVALDPEVRQKTHALDAITVHLKADDFPGMSKLRFHQIHWVVPSPDGQSLYAAAMISGDFSADQPRQWLDRILVLDAGTLELEATHRLPWQVSSLAISPDGRWLACGCQAERRQLGRRVLSRGVIAIVDTDSGDITAEHAGEFGSVTNIDFDPRGKELAFATDDAQVLIWSYAIDIAK